MEKEDMQKSAEEIQWLLIEIKELLEKILAK